MFKWFRPVRCRCYTIIYICTCSKKVETEGSSPFLQTVRDYSIHTNYGPVYSIKGICTASSGCTSIRCLLYEMQVILNFLDLSTFDVQFCTIFLSTNIEGIESMFCIVLNYVSFRDGAMV